MINLLPPHHKTQLAAEERFRLMAASGLALVAFLLAFVLLLLSVFLYLEGGITAQKTLLLSAQEAQSEDEVRVLKEIKERNGLLSQVEQFYSASLTPSIVFERLAADLPQGVYLTVLTSTATLPQGGKGEAKDGPRGRIALSGRAATREHLREFQARLLADPVFEEVLFPPSSWVALEDVEFSITMFVPERALQTP